MVTIRYYINQKKKRNDGLMNVKIIITYRRKRKMLPTSIYVDGNGVTRGGKLRDPNIKAKVDAIIANYSQRVLEMGLEFEERDVDYIANRLKRNAEADFFAFAQMLIKEIANPSTHRAYLFAVKCVKDFTGRDTLAFSEMGVPFFKAMERHLTSRAGRVTGGVVLVLSLIKAIYKKAQIYYNDGDREVVPHYPLLAYFVPKKPPVTKKALGIDKIREFMNAELKGAAGMVRDIYILSFCLMGMNLVDIFNCEYTSDDKICYNRTKTKTRRDDMAYIEVQIDERIRPLVDMYRGQKHMFLFKEKYSCYASFRSVVTEYLRVNIPKLLGCEPFIFYSARHSFATIAYSDCGIDKYTVHSMLNHAAKDMSITDIYIKRNFEVENAANKKVLDLLFNGR